MSRATGIPCAEYAKEREIGRRVAVFEGTPMTVREVRIARHTFDQGMVRASGIAGTLRGVPSDTACQRYPMPTITRPREVLIGTRGAHGGTHAKYRVVSGFLEMWTGAAWRQIDGICPQTWTPEGLVALAELFSRPTEEVEAE